MACEFLRIRAQYRRIIGLYADNRAVRARRMFVQSMILGGLAAILYGVVHDQITVRISPEYLVDWHPTIIPSRDPTVVALAWGIVATWWFGLILGSLLGATAILGRWPRAPWAWVMRTMAGIFVFAALAATVSGVVTKALRIELPDLFGPPYPDLSREGRLAFSQAAVIHSTSYWTAGLGAGLGAGLILLRRRRSAR